MCAALAAVDQSAAQASQAASTLKIGVTLHPYYSWTRNVVGDLKGYEVRPILPGEIDAGDYQPRPEDIKKLVDLDAIVINGIGHDDFIVGMIKAAGNPGLKVIRINETTPQIHSAHGTGVNSHTFISFTNAVQQTYAIQKALAGMRPADAAALQRNAADYARRLRLIKSKAAQRLAEAKITRVVTVHDGYGYLMQEFGLEIAGVVQPAHGLTPSAAELRDMPSDERPLSGLVAIVAGATRGAGRGIARGLGEAGATVYCTGRSTTGHPSPYKRPETIDETAELIRAGGGTAIPVRVDHTVESEVEALVKRVVKEHGRLDILVNSIAGEDPRGTMDRRGRTTATRFPAC